MIDASKLTTRELHATLVAVGTEWKRRQKHQAKLRRGWTALQSREERERAIRPEPAVTRPRGLGGEVLRIEGTHRVVRCCSCGSEFHAPRQRGRAPRDCDPCKADA